MTKEELTMLVATCVKLYNESHKHPCTDTDTAIGFCWVMGLITDEEQKELYFAQPRITLIN